MVPNDIWLRTEWLSCRRTSVLRCVERYCAAAAREYRRALRRVQEVEETMAQVEPETGRRLPSQPAQAELLNRRLAAANAEIRRYQTRLYACEREMVALRQENAELEALCEQARANSLLPPVPPQPKVLEQPGLPVIVFHPARMPPRQSSPSRMLRRNRAHRSRSLPRRPHRRNRRRNAVPLRSRTGSPPRHSTIRQWIWYISWKA